MNSVFDYIGLREARPESEKNSTDPRFAAGLYLLKSKNVSARGQMAWPSAAQCERRKERH